MSNAKFKKDQVWKKVRVLGTFTLVNLEVLEVTEGFVLCKFFRKGFSKFPVWTSERVLLEMTENSKLEM